jgi:hypothetical protein
MRKLSAPGLVLAAICFAAPAEAARLSGPVAVFAGLDKVSGEITTLEVNVNESVRFGTLSVHPRVCNYRPVTEEPKTTSFVEIDDIDPQGQAKRVFTGWMFAESPALNALEHPVYDVWLTGCKDPSTQAPQQDAAPATTPEFDPQSIPKDNE